MKRSENSCSSWRTRIISFLSMTSAVVGAMGVAGAMQMEVHHVLSGITLGKDRLFAGKFGDFSAETSGVQERLHIEDAASGARSFWGAGDLDRYSSTG